MLTFIKQSGPFILLQFLLALIIFECNWPNI